MIDRCSLSSAWPTNSASRRGRSPASSSPASALRVEQLVALGGRVRAPSPRPPSRSVDAARPRRCRACRAGAAPASPSSGSSRERLARSRRARSRARRARRATSARTARAAAPGRPAPTAGGERRSSGRSRRDLSSTSRRAAVFLPTPGTRHRASTSSSASTRRSAVGACTERMASASAGPTPWAPIRASKHDRSSSVAKP